MTGAHQSSLNNATNPISNFTQKSEESLLLLNKYLGDGTQLQEVPLYMESSLR